MYKPKLKTIFEINDNMEVFY